MGTAGIDAMTLAARQLRYMDLGKYTNEVHVAVFDFFFYCLGRTDEEVLEALGPYIDARKEKSIEWKVAVYLGKVIRRHQSTPEQAWVLETVLRYVQSILGISAAFDKGSADQMAEAMGGLIMAAIAAEDDQVVASVETYVGTLPADSIAWKSAKYVLMRLRG